MARMKSAQTVYYGPAYSGYPSVGSVSANESVDFLWTEGAWCYIRYSVSGTANKKCGYVPETAVNHANESPLIYNDNNSGDRYIRDGGTNASVLYKQQPRLGIPSRGCHISIKNP